MAKRELTWEEQHARKKRWKAFWDKITTGLLILLMAAPFAILAYISAMAYGISKKFPKE